MRKVYLILALTIQFLFSFSVNIDSVFIKLNKAKNDSVKIDLLYRSSLNKKIPARITDSLFNVLQSFKSAKNCDMRSYAWIKIGLYYNELEQPNSSIENLIRSLKVADSCQNERMQMLSRYWLSFVNKTNENFSDAKEHAYQSIQLAKKLKDSTILANNYTLLGNMFKTEMKLDSALMYHTKALDIRENSKDLRELALTYNNLGLVYKNMKVFNKALDYLRLSLTLKMKVEKSSIYGPYNNIGIVFKNMGNYDSAIFYGNLVIKEALKYKKSKALGEGVSSLAEAYEGKKDYKKATHYYSRLRTITDSVNKEGINSKISDLQSRYESDKKDSDLKLKEESLRTAEALNSRKNIMISLSVVALLMAIIASVFIFRSYKQSKRNALQLSFKNKVIEEKNKEITDSINYAKNIQQSLITSEKVFTENLKDHFILYLPKDIVSGDFYWAQKIGEEFIIMCADCTGHGVPGAFMSLMGIGNLKELVNQKQLTRPDVILNELRERIIESFGMSNNKDGMDASLLKLNGFQMQVAAANNPIWIIRNNENLVVKPDKFPVGNYLGELSPFSLNTIQLQTNDLVLMYTDGYADQFGGPNNKKHKNKAIEKLILDNHHLPLDKIQQLLLNNFQQWKGTNEQVDDVLVIGFRV
jgi:serine phosphatase RsbU (regulator of sigma subunit)